ncbi:TIGR02757 family protein [Kiritimatiellota bacterium B12222]|nr:TIGR02757 family protein [Kiritimatiellota bacterium B12222]
MKADNVPALSRLHGVERRQALEWNYHRFNHAHFRSSDPLQFVWDYHSPADREVAAWAASALAYGRVAAIQNALKDLHQRWQGQPALFLSQASKKEQQQALKGFVYRWTRAPHLLAHLRGWQHVHSTEPMWQRLKTSDCRNYREALIPILGELREAEGDPGHLCPDPSANSACKRLAMWLRWMVRKDEIDPGLWSEHLDPAKLWVPLDTHMFRIAKQLRLTQRKAPDAEAARRITAAFGRICPQDPVRYDFAITRMGMAVADAPRE